MSKPDDIEQYIPEDERAKKMEAKVQTFLLGEEYGVMVSFLYTDKSPDIYRKRGFKTEEEAFQFGKKIVHDVISQVKGATIIESGTVH